MLVPELVSYAFDVIGYICIDESSRRADVHAVFIDTLRLFVSFQLHLCIPTWSIYLVIPVILLSRVLLCMIFVDL